MTREARSLHYLKALVLSLTLKKIRSRISMPLCFLTSATENGLFPLPPIVSELNSVMCRNLSREVNCVEDVLPSVYSVGRRSVYTL